MSRWKRTTFWSAGVASLAAAAALVVAALPATATAAHSPPAKPANPPHGQGGSARGIVQSLTANTVLVKELDGTSVEIPVGPSTHVFVNGRLATLDAVRPGLVATASWKAGKAATKLQLFGASATIGVVKSRTAQSVVVTMPSGTNVTIRVTPKTRVFVDGRRAQLGAVKPGFLLVLTGAVSTKRAAAELRFLRPG
jgi:hypothetical protein